MSIPTSEAKISGLPRAVSAVPTQLVLDGLREVLGRRRLIRYMVGADLKRTHADTLLGQLWWIVDPFLQMAIYVVLVAIIFRRPTPDYPLFVIAATLAWKWLSTSLSAASTAVTGREGLIRQIPFPKLVLPVAETVAGTLSFAFGLLALAIMYTLFLHRLTPWVLAIPLIAAVQFVFTLGLAVALACMNAFYRDVQNVLGHLLRLWFYLSPGLYSISDISDARVRKLLALNPMAAILESYRNVIYGTKTTGGVAPDFLGLAVVFVFSLALLAVAVFIFKRVEPAFARIL